MRITETIFFATALLSPVFVCAAQTTAGTPASPTAAAGTSFKPSPPSQILQRSLDEVQLTAGGVRLDKWKRGTVRDEAATNIDAIQRDLRGTLPALLKEADSNPSSLSKALPLSRNVDALYDVLVHVVEGARVAGTSEQVGQLKQAMQDLEKARLALDNQMQQVADAQEKQIVALQGTVQKQEASLRAAATPPPAPKCPAPTPAKKKPAAKPSATSTTKPAAGTPSNQPPKTQ
ncbi:MAG TPA: hypothetical protein VKB47_11505 [Terracidiphilus sp.]|nr:hypothetical protein [Terracidiphilus sp.]